MSKPEEQNNDLKAPNDHLADVRDETSGQANVRSKPEEQEQVLNAPNDPLAKVGDDDASGQAKERSKPQDDYDDPFAKDENDTSAPAKTSSKHQDQGQVLNDAPFNPFADIGDDNDNAGEKEGLVHIRIQQRNGRKTLTTVQGISTEYNSKKILKIFKKDFACNGTVVDDAKSGEVIQLSGDQRVKIAEFLIAEGIAKKANIKVHGF